MTETKSQMLEARHEFMAMLRSAAPFLAIVLCMVLAIELWFTRSVPLISLGAFVGCTYALLNLSLLFWWIAPFFFFREKPIFVLSAVLVSLCVGALLMFVATFMGQRWAIGLAFGIASPAVIGALHSLGAQATTSKTPKLSDIPLDLH